MQKRGGSFNLQSLDEIFTTAEERQEAKLEKVWEIPLKERCHLWRADAGYCQAQT